MYTFTFDSQKLVPYSDNAFTRMRDVLNDGIDMGDGVGQHVAFAIWASHGTSMRKGSRPRCT